MSTKGVYYKSHTYAHSMMTFFSGDPFALIEIATKKITPKVNTARLILKCKDFDF